MKLNVELPWDSWRHMSTVDFPDRVMKFQPKRGNVLELELWVFLGRRSARGASEVASWRFVAPTEGETLGLGPKIVQLEPAGSLSYFCGRILRQERLVFGPRRIAVGGKIRLDMVLDCGLPVVASSLSRDEIISRDQELGFLEGVGKLWAFGGFAPRVKPHPTIFGKLVHTSVTEERSASDLPKQMTIEVLPGPPATYLRLDRA